jgi:ABC-type transporter Mla maintaining outer membrane lipid asymmetry ATPase subunit MlaF
VATPPLEGVSWSVAAGEFWVVVGLPDSGKSQLLETIAGLRPLLAGTLRLFGQETGAMSHEELRGVRRRIGLVFPEGGRLFPSLTITENIGLPLAYAASLEPEAAARQVESLLEATELGRFGPLLPARLNASWRQRVALARALAPAPEVLLLDDPIAGSDPRQARWWPDFLGRLATGRTALARPPLTLVVATDDLRPWLGGAQRVALLKERRCLLLGSPAEANASGDPLWRELLAEAAPSG